jgi:hypothetical protein
MINNNVSVAMPHCSLNLYAYYQRLNNFFHGSGKDPGNFISPPSCHRSYTTDVVVPASVPAEYRWLFERLEEYTSIHPELIKNMIVQGSYGDFTNTEYSDLDVVVFLNQSVVENRKKRAQFKTILRKKLMPLIYSIDPLQHHGVFLLWPGFCECYLENILPLVVYSRAWAVKQINMRFTCSSHKSTPRLPGLLRTILAEYKQVKIPKNFYYIKRFTSHIMMVPCIYFMDRGTYLHKVLSFAPFIRKFQTTAQLMSDVTEIRRKWRGAPRTVKMIAHGGYGSRVLKRYFPVFNGLFYRSKEIIEYIHHIDINVLAQLNTSVTNELY